MTGLISRLIAAAALAASASVLVAATPAPVHWQVTSAPHGPVHPGAKFQLGITGRIDPGWHLYALEEPDGGPVATQVALTEGDPADLVSVASGKPRTLQDPQFAMQTSLFVNSVAFMLHLQAASAPSGPYMLHVLIRYQSCNDQVCLPPHTDTVPVPVTLAP